MKAVGTIDHDADGRRITAAMIAAKAQANGGTATYTTVQGDMLSFRKVGKGRSWTARAT